MTARFGRRQLHRFLRPDSQRHYGLNNQKIDYAPCSYDIPQVLRVNGLYALPFHGNRLVEGWQLKRHCQFLLADIRFNVATGFDQLEQLGWRSAAVVFAHNPASGAYPACNNQPMLRTLSLWYNPNCYGLGTGRHRTEIPPEQSPRPRLLRHGCRAVKDTKLTERVNAQFRAEFFNVLNHPNFAIPTGSVFTTTGAISSAAGVITATNQNTNPRQIQFALKLTF